jgi:cystathionine beta-lyase
MREKTKLLHLEDHDYLVNPPIEKASTIIFRTTGDFLKSTTYARDGMPKPPAYGRHGTPSIRLFEEVMAKLDNAYDSFVMPSGVSAINTAIISLLKAGDHVICTDSVYSPTRDYLDHISQHLCIELDYVDPLDNEAWQQKIKPNTKLFFMEAPGSITFEVCDINFIVELANKQNAYTLIDNTWATPLYFKPLNYGVDVVLHSATKYILGHSDGLMGVMSCNERTYPHLKKGRYLSGVSVPAEAVYYAHRGLKTLAVRLEAHEKATKEMVDFLQQKNYIDEVLYPAIAGNSKMAKTSHQNWQKYFTGASGLFGIVFTPDISLEQVCQFIDKLELFVIGYSWGGYESLIIPCPDMQNIRTAKAWHGGQLARIHVGLEDVADLKADINNAEKALL